MYVAGAMISPFKLLHCEWFVPVVIVTQIRQTYWIRDYVPDKRGESMVENPEIVVAVEAKPALEGRRSPPQRKRKNRCCYFKKGCMLKVHALLSSFRRVTYRIKAQMHIASQMWKFRKPHFLTPYVGPTSTHDHGTMSYDDKYILDLLGKRR